jgi:hypothetical protein
VRSLRWILAAACLSLPPAIPAPVQAAETPAKAGALDDFFSGLKKGTPVEIVLDKGKTVKGLFSSFDNYYDTVWIVPRGEHGAFTQKSYKLAGIRGAKVLEKTADSNNLSAAEHPGDDDYYLLKESGF